MEWSSHFQNDGRFIRILHDLGTASLYKRYEVNLLNGDMLSTIHE